MHFWGVFRTFLEKFFNDFANLWSKVRIERSEPPCQVSWRGKIFGPRYSSLKVGFSSKTTITASKDRLITSEPFMLRKFWFDILNQRKILFHPCFIRFSLGLRLRGLILPWKWLILTCKNMLFSWFFEISRPTTDQIWTKFGMRIASKHTKTLQKTAPRYLS